MGRRAPFGEASRRRGRLKSARRTTPRIPTSATDEVDLDDLLAELEASREHPARPRAVHTIASQNRNQAQRAMDLYLIRPRSDGGKSSPAPPDYYRKHHQEGRQWEKPLPPAHAQIRIMFARMALNRAATPGSSCARARANRIDGHGFVGNGRDGEQLPQLRNPRTRYGSESYMLDRCQ